MSKDSKEFDSLYKRVRLMVILLFTNLLLLIIWFSLPPKVENPEPISIPETQEELAVGSVDPESKLVVDEGYLLIKQHCQACHNLELVTQNFFTREVWLEKIRWMQAEQNLWDLGDNEPLILDYLAKYYNPEKKPGHQMNLARRQNIKVEEWYALD